LPSDTDSGIVTIISVHLKSKSLLRKEIYDDLQKKPETPREWRHIKIKSAPLESALSKTLYREITISLTEQQRKSLFCIGSTDLFPVFFSSRAQGWPEHHREMCNSSFERKSNL
jgi:hypothetical protein